MNPLPLPLRVAAGLAAVAVERARDLPARIAGFPVTVVSEALQASMRLQQHVTELAIKGDEALAVLRPHEESPEWATFDEDIDTAGSTAAPAPRAERRPAAGPDTDLDAETEPELEPDLESVLPDPDEVLGSEADIEAEIAAIEAEVAQAQAAEAAELAAEVAALTESAEPATTEPATTKPATTEPAATRPADSDDLSDLDDLSEPEPEPEAAPAVTLDNYDELSLPQLRARLRGFSVDELEELLAHERGTANRPSFVGMLTRRIATVRDQR